MHIHRECIIETKWKYDVAPEDKQLAFKQMIINFIEVSEALQMQGCYRITYMGICWMIFSFSLGEVR